jgi:curli biogenesis system outer membrane secretion channel CsgG
MARRDFWLLTLLCATLSNAALPIPLAAQSQQRPRIAIIDFEARPGGWTLPPPRVGVTVAQLMLNRLVEASPFQVFDGQWLRGASVADSRASHDALLANAREAGVDYVVLGSITQFSMEQKYRNVGGAGLFRRLPIAGGSRRQTSQLSVSILVRVVDVHSGEVVTTATGVGAGKRTGVAIGGLVARLPLVGGLSRGASESRDAQLDEATRQAVDAASAALVNAAPRLAASH